MVASGFGARFGIWDYRVAFSILRWSTYAALAIVAFALLGLLVPRIRSRAWLALVVALVVAGMAAAFPLVWMQRARSLPPVNDITTDPEHPPAFVAILPLRKDATVPAAYAGPEAAELQRRGYPDIAPIHVDDDPRTAFAAALAIATRLGWEVVAAESTAGVIEATATTPWFGFHDDVVVRIAPEGPGSRIDIRSVSRVGRGDFGTNARRVREFASAFTAPEAR
ncbi:MAG: DUF1499 domain-containing protein [Betaproteobacteria bacterium]